MCVCVCVCACVCIVCVKGIRVPLARFDIYIYIYIYYSFQKMNKKEARGISMEYKRKVIRYFEVQTIYTLSQRKVNQENRKNKTP